MPNRNTDKLDFATQGTDVENDPGSRGGPATGPGRADNHHIASKPYDDDLQTQIATQGKKKPHGNEEKNGNTPKNNQ